MSEEKKVIMPLSELEELVECRDELKAVKEELRKDCKERGLYVEEKIVWSQWSNLGYEQPLKRLSIYSKDEVLAKAAEEIDRLTRKVEEIAKEKNEVIDHLLNRNLWQRIWNKE